MVYFPEMKMVNDLQVDIIKKICQVKVLNCLCWMKLD